MEARIILVLRNIRCVLVVAKVDNIFPNRLTEVTEKITLITYLFLKKGRLCVAAVSAVLLQWRILGMFFVIL